MQKETDKYTVVVCLDASLTRIVTRFRDKDPWCGYKNFPGGKFLIGEDAKDCLKRELFEETGLDIPTEEIHFLRRDVDEGKKDLHIYYTILAQEADEYKLVEEGARELLTWDYVDDLFLSSDDYVPDVPEIVGEVLRLSLTQSECE